MAPLPAAYPPQWLAVLVLTAAASPSPPPSRMPPPPSPPSPYVFKSSFGLKAAAQEFDNDTAAAIARYGPIADWDVSAISNMGAIFYNLRYFNADISSWDTSSVTHMSAMFLAARAFNQPLSFDTSSVTAMAGMFQASLSTQCVAANWPICNLDPLLLQGASAFDQSLDLDTSRVTTMKQMFYVRAALHADIAVL